jgi:hypothetical protein
MDKWSAIVIANIRQKAVSPYIYDSLSSNLKGGPQILRIIWIKGAMTSRNAFSFTSEDKLVICCYMGKVELS